MLDIPQACCRRFRWPSSQVSRAGRGEVSLWVGICAALLTSSLAVGADGWLSIVSSSGQFTVRGLPVGQLKSAPVSHSSLVVLDPSLLVVTCETLRTAVVRELGLPTGWQGPIFIQLHPARSGFETVRVHAMRSAERWSYRVEMPDEMPSGRLIRLLVEVILLEHANRGAKDTRVELPPWLAPGLAARLEAKGLDAAVLSPARSVAVVRGNFLGAGNTEATVLMPDRPAALTQVRTDEATVVRNRLGAQPALTVEELNWPADLPVDGPGRARYDASAHLFVLELCRLRDGPSRLCGLLERLPDHLNWQVAFLEAFRGHFDRMVDVEKWWSLVVTRYTNHDPGMTLSFEESLQRLDEVLYTPVEVRLEKDDLPHQSQVSLQTVLLEWKPALRLATLRDKAARLAALQPRLAPEVALVAEEYRDALTGYLNLAQARLTAPASKLGTDARLASLRGTVNRLHQLDARRQRLWASGVPVSPPGSPQRDRRAD